MESRKTQQELREQRRIRINKKHNDFLIEFKEQSTKLKEQSNKIKEEINDLKSEINLLKGFWKKKLKKI
jgi:flagellar hook-associated protein FlgK